MAEKQTPLLKALSIFGIKPDDSPAFDHLLRDLKLLFSNAPDESLLAYYDTRQLVFEWLAKQGDEKRFGGRPTKKGNAFYYYKQAMKYGDPKAAGKYLKKYYELGGARKADPLSIKYAHPLSSIPTMKRNMFRQSVSPKQEDRIQTAVEWWHHSHSK